MVDDHLPALEIGQVSAHPPFLVNPPYGPMNFDPAESRPPDNL